MCEGYLSGIVSWGGNCGQKAGVYTRMTSYASSTAYIPLSDLQSSAQRAFSFINVFHIFLYIFVYLFIEKIFLLF